MITGQATCSKELFEDMGLLDAVITPVGGGGLLSGTCLSTFYYSPDTAVYAGEPEGAADAVLSFKTGKIEKAPFINTIARITSYNVCYTKLLRSEKTNML